MFKMKFLKIFFLFNFFLSPILASEKGYPVFVSLGSYCEVATKLKEHGLREKAFPFDWLLTANHQTLIKIFDEDFKEFLDEEALFQLRENPSILENHHYKIEFRHDPPKDPLKADLHHHIQDIFPKYMRRIDRFRNLKNCPEKVFFLRTAYDVDHAGSHYWIKEGLKQYITNEEAIELKKALERYFPQLDFTLVILNYKEEGQKKFDYDDKILEFQIRKNKKAIEYAILFKKLSNFYP